MPRVIPLTLLAACTSCIGVSQGTEPDPRGKVEMDLTCLDADGLRGPPGGRVSMSYEFCIPNTPECRAEVKAIDRTAQLSPGSRGRIGCGNGQCLCIGSTHQANYRQVLRRLAGLPYVGRIVECHFE